MELTQRWAIGGRTIAYSFEAWGRLEEEIRQGFKKYPWGGVEVGGILTGERVGEAVTIFDYRAVECEHAMGPSYELSERDVARLKSAIVKAREDGAEVVGWYHTVSHRELGLTEADRGVMERCLGEDWQVTVVVKRSKNEAPVTGVWWRDCGGLAEAVLEPEAPVVIPVRLVTETVDAFGLSPDPEFFYPSQQHGEALANLLYGIRGKKGYVMLTGESGVGKTMVMECLTDLLRADGIEYAYLFNSRVTTKELFELLAIDFGLKVDGESKTAVLMALNERLIERAGKGLLTALLIDDAHRLSTEVLEEIELLGNLETRKGKLLQVVMAARPGFEKRMEEEELRGFRQRFVLRPRLGALTEKETGEYIAFRMRKSGREGFAEGVCGEIYRLTGGVPRLISAVCGRMLELGVGDEEGVKRVAEEFEF